jgi:predicted phage terminase large subunit-like protein
VIAINPEGGKTARMFAAAAEWQAGDWLVDRNAAWTEAFVEQITMFPNARNDDMCDAMSQAACWLAQFRVSTARITNAFTGELLEEFS